MPATESMILGGPFGGINEIEAEQQQSEWDFLANVDFDHGDLRARNGWRILGKAYTDAFTPSPGQTVYTEAHNVAPSLYAPTRATTAASYCIGAHATRVADVLLRFLVIRRIWVPASSAWTVSATIYDDVGDVVGAATNLSSTFGEPTDPPGPFVFAEVFDKVYFTAGAGIYVWDKFARSEIKQIVFEAHPVYSADAFWVTSQLRARLITKHQDRLFYAGIPEDLHVTFSGQIPANDDTSTAAVAGRGDTPLSLNEGRTSALFYPAHLFWSEPGYPKSVRHSSFWVNPEGDAITAITEYKEAVVIWTANSMFLWEGDGTETWRVRKLSSGNGCVAQRTVQTTNDGRLVWCSRDGVCVFDGAEIKVVTRRLRKTWSSQGPSLFPRQDSSIRAAVKDMRLPWAVDQSMLPWASAINRRGAQQYWIALTTKSSSTPNNVILVWDYSNDRIWFHASRATDSEVSATYGICSWDVLLTDPGVNAPVYAITRNELDVSYPTAKRGQARSSLSEYAGEWDETMNNKGGVQQVRVAMLGVGARKGITANSQTAPLAAWVWMYGLHSNLLTSEADSERPVLVAFTEWAGYDQARASVSAADKQEKPWLLEMWPENIGDAVLATPSTWEPSGVARYFFQPATGSTSNFNCWDSTATPLDSTLRATLTWLAPEMAEVKCHLPAFPSHWFRLCIFESPKTRGPRLRLVGLAVDFSSGWRKNE